MSSLEYTTEFKFKIKKSLSYVASRKPHMSTLGGKIPHKSNLEFKNATENLKTQQRV